MYETVEVGSDRVGEDYVAFRQAGEQAKGAYHCTDCGYGVTIYRELPACPMCSGTAWEETGWSPMTRARITPS